MSVCLCLVPVAGCLDLLFGFHVALCFSFFARGVTWFHPTLFYPCVFLLLTLNSCGFALALFLDCPWCLFVTYRRQGRWICHREYTLALFFHSG